MDLRAIGDKIIVKVDKDETVTKSGLILTSATQERHYSGIVVDAGPDDNVKKSGIEVGDWVFYQKGYNFEFQKDGIDYDIVSVFDTLCVGKKQ